MQRFITPKFFLMTNLISYYHYSLINYFPTKLTFKITHFRVINTAGFT